MLLRIVCVCVKNKEKKKEEKKKRWGFYFDCEDGGNNFLLELFPFVNL